MPWRAVQAEQVAELERVLASATFQKAPNQCRLLRYLCDRYFDKSAGQLKEHQIATEALGRTEDFDGRENSIVRVELFRLRKRLQRYYESEGASNPIVMALDPGRYVIRFAAREASEHDNDPVPAAADVVTADQPRPEEQAAPQSSVHRTVRPAGGRAFAVIASGVALLIVIAIVLSKHGARASDVSGPTMASQADAIGPANGDEVRILAGYNRPVHIDRLGQVWRGDKWYSGGEAADVSRQFLTRVPDPTLFSHCRVGSFSYDIPLKRGWYELRLYFGPSLRPVTLEPVLASYPMKVQIGDQEHDLNLNFVPDGAAAPTADIRVFKDVTPGRDGMLHLRFWTAGQYSFVNAIEITPGMRGRLLPIRINTSEYSYTDRSGRIWPPDRFFLNGTAIERRDVVSGTADPDLFRSERFGNFDYLIPVANGTYSVTLGFAEMWFGPKLPGGGGPGSRLFDVSCNNTPLDKALDVYRESGGSERALVKTFHGLRPDKSGKLKLSFGASRNHATVSFIEVADESK